MLAEPFIWGSEEPTRPKRLERYDISPWDIPEMMFPGIHTRKLGSIWIDEWCPGYRGYWRDPPMKPPARPKDPNQLLSWLCKWFGIFCPKPPKKPKIGATRATMSARGPINNRRR